MKTYYVAEPYEWYASKDYLPALDWIKLFHYEHKMLPEFIVHIKGFPFPTVAALDQTYTWFDPSTGDNLEEGCIDYWMLMPVELPGDAELLPQYRTEVVNQGDTWRNEYHTCQLTQVNKE